MKHKTNVCVTRRTTRQVSLCLNSIAVGGPIRHLTFVLETNAGDEYMVLQILAHAGQVLNDVNSKAAQRLRLPNAREHQKLRAIDGARGEDHFLVCAISLLAPSLLTVTPTQRVPLKFSFTTLVLSSRVRFGLDNAGRRKARTALTRVPSAAMFMLM